MKKSASVDDGLDSAQRRRADCFSKAATVDLCGSEEGLEGEGVEVEVEVKVEEVVAAVSPVSSRDDEADCFA